MAPHGVGAAFVRKVRVPDDAIVGAMLLTPENAARREMFQLSVGGGACAPSRRADPVLDSRPL